MLGFNLKRKILLFGGFSIERYVSVATAQNIVGFIEDPVCWFWSKTGEVFEVLPRSLLTHSDPFLNEFSAIDYIKRFNDISLALDSLSEKGNILFLAVHGKICEDGSLQNFLESRKLSFTGSSCNSSRIAFNKNLSKLYAAREKIRVPSCIVVKQNNLREFVKKHGKVILKPMCDGSSSGVFIVNNVSEADRVNVLTDSSYIAENFINGREFSVGVIGGANKTFALPCTEIMKNENMLFDYDSKYLTTNVKEITPTNATTDVTDALSRMATKIHKSINCSGYSRSDFIVDKNGPVFLEINTLPGLTVKSIISQQLKVAGVPMKLFIELQLKLAHINKNNY